MKAIKETGNVLVAALDKFDSVGIIDSHFPQADFFTEFERFDRHIDKLRRNGTKIDYVGICSPNYLHDSHIRFALRHQADAICEKPLVLNPWNMDALAEIEKETGRKIYTILQLRLHPAIQSLKKEIESGKANAVYEVDLNYVTARGKWYHHSWKGDESKSGGIATNIGIHFFDMLVWIFGSVKENILEKITDDRASGRLKLERANVKWFLSIDARDLPQQAVRNGKSTHRSLKIQGKEVEFSEGFTDLHTESYKEILAGRGFGLQEARASIEVAYRLRSSST
jgi:UDP-N-acetyl-2-amino-2-deoxyglucuronate dehydrogenase